jgi:hypothetical protein
MADAANPRRESSPPPADEYEFSDVHKESFRALAMSMSSLGIFSMLIGGLFAVFALGALYEGFVPNGVVIGAGSVVQMLMASWLLSAGRSLSAMMRTKGRDVQCVMDAVLQLRRYFGMTLVLLMITILGSIAVVVWCAVGTGKCFGLLG